MLDAFNNDTIKQSGAQRQLLDRSALHDCKRAPASVGKRCAYYAPSCCAPACLRLALREVPMPSIVVINDEPNIIEGVRRRLDAEGYSVRAFMHGPEALVALGEAGSGLAPGIEVTIARSRFT